MNKIAVTNTKYAQDNLLSFEKIILRYRGRKYLILI